MKKFIFAMSFIILTTSALAAELGEDQNPPKSSKKGGCEYARAIKKYQAKTASTTTPKSRTMDLKN